MSFNEIETLMDVTREMLKLKISDDYRLFTSPGFSINSRLAQKV